MNLYKLTAVLALIGFVGFAAADLNAVVQPASPDDIELNSTNGYTVFKTFDGSASTGDYNKYSWNLVGDSQTDTGSGANFTFDRDLSDSNTVSLEVSNQTNSDKDTVTQDLHDIPQVRMSLNTSTSINNDTTVKFSSFTNNSYDTPEEYTWYLNGNNKSASANFTWRFNDTYASKGGSDQTVEVNFSDSTERYDTASKTVTVTCSNCGGSNNNNNNGGSGSSGGGGGGGGAGTSVAASHSKILNTVKPGEPAEFSSMDPESFGMKKITVSVSNKVLDASIEVKEQEGKPADVEVNVSGKTYRYMNIQAENLSEKNVESANISFHVSKDWIDNNSVDPSNIKLHRYNNSEWNGLKTMKTGESDQNISYRAMTPGFSYFAVAAEQEEESTEEQTTDDTETQQNQTEETEVRCGDGTCQQNETWQTCSQDCSKPDAVEQAEKALENARQKLSQGDPGYSKLQTAQTAFDNGEYTRAKNLAEQALNETGTGQGGGLMPVLIVLLVVALVAGVGYYKREEIQEFVENY